MTSSPLRRSEIPLLSRNARDVETPFDRVRLSFREVVRIAVRRRSVHSFRPSILFLPPFSSLVRTTVRLGGRPKLCSQSERRYNCLRGAGENYTAVAAAVAVSASYTFA